MQHLVAGKVRGVGSEKPGETKLLEEHFGQALLGPGVRGPRGEGEGWMAKGCTRLRGWWHRGEGLVAQG